MRTACKPGQILILVLLIIVVALAVGLSVAARNVTNLRTSAQTEQSQRAFTTAEGGVEDILSRLSSVATAISGGAGTPDCSVVVNIQATCDIVVGSLHANVLVNSSTTYQSTIELGSVGQIDLKGATGGGLVKIEWAKAGETPAATLMVIQYTAAGGVYGQDRKLYQGDASAGRTEGINFTDPNASGSCTGADGYLKCVLVPVAPNALFLRIKPYWIKTSVRVTGANITIPVQTYNISSAANTSGINRKVQVTRTALPQLPAVFDYALFSGSSITK